MVEQPSFCFTLTCNNFVNWAMIAVNPPIINKIFKVFDANKRNLSHPVIAEFKNYTQSHYRENLNRRKVSKAIGVSESYLTALLKQHSKTNFTDYLTKIRLEKAMELIEYSNLKIKEICAATGFNSVSYFVRKFGVYYGKSPNRFRR